MGNKITVNVIAQSLGMSRNTVSKVLNGKYVPKKTKDLVLQKAKELNYKSMGAVHEEEKAKILLLSGKPLNSIPYFIPVVRRIENICYEREIDLYQYTIDKRKNVFDTLQDVVKNFSINGIICIETLDTDTVNRILKLKIATCFIDFPCVNETQTNTNYDIVLPSSEEIGYIIKRCAEANIIKQVSFVGDYNHCLSFNRRYLTMVDSLFVNDYSHKMENDITLNDATDLGDITILKNSIEQKAKNTNIFICANDFIANKTVLALKLLKKRIPEDVMVLGFDGTDEEKNEKPGITTINVEKEFVGQKAVDSLLERIAKGDIPKSTIYIASKLVIRDTLKF